METKLVVINISTVQIQTIEKLFFNAYNQSMTQNRLFHETCNVIQIR